MIYLTLESKAEWKTEKSVYLLLEWYETKHEHRWCKNFNFPNHFKQTCGEPSTGIHIRGSLRPERKANQKSRELHQFCIYNGRKWEEIWDSALIPNKDEEDPIVWTIQRINDKVLFILSTYLFYHCEPGERLYGTMEDVKYNVVFSVLCFRKIQCTV